MTTKVTVTASGDSYPARVTHVRRKGPDSQVLFDGHIISGESKDFWVGTDDRFLVEEEYHLGGFKRQT